MVKQGLDQIAKQTDAEKLRMMIGRMESQSGQIPPEMKAGFEVILGAARERLAALGTAPKPDTKPATGEAKPAEKK